MITITVKLGKKRRKRMPKIRSTDVEAGSCSICGAVRPQLELVAEQGCANCANLKLMEEQIKNKEINEEETKKQNLKLTETLKNLPDLDKPASSLYDDERGVWWLGINCKEPKADPINLMLLMDQSKVAMLSAFADWKRKESLRNKLTLGIVSKISNGAKDVTDKVKELLTR